MLLQYLTDEEIPIGSLIMAFADIFTAVTEDRPYRQGMDREQVLGVMKQLVEDSTLCPFVYKMVVKYYDVLDSVRREAQGRSSAV